MKVRIGTRGSDLARAQSTTVGASLAARGLEFELVIIRTAGDRSSAASFASIGPQGVFVREIEEALLADDIDLAVHSYKDLPTRSSEALVVAAVPQRHDAADVLLVREAALAHDRTLLPLPSGARVGTSSARRRVWIAHFRPDIATAPLRGNVPTRIRRLRDGDYDAIVLAAAGIERLREGSDALDGSFEGIAAVRLDPGLFVPAPSQGALALQCRRDRDDVLAMLAALDHAPSRAAVAAEREALRLAEGGCDVAFGAHCAAAADGYDLTAMIERDGRVLTGRARSADPAVLAPAAWRALTEAS